MIRMVVERKGMGRGDGGDRGMWRRALAWERSFSEHECVFNNFSRNTLCGDGKGGRRVAWGWEERAARGYGANPMDSHGTTTPPMERPSVNNYGSALEAV